MIDIKKIFPIYAVQHQAMVSVQGDITIAYRLQLPSLFSQSADDYEAQHQAWIKALRVLPRHSVVHKTDWFRQRRWQADPPTGRFLEDAGNRHYEGRAFTEHSCSLMLTKKAEDRKAASSSYSGLMRKSIVPRQTVDAKQISGFFEKAGAFERILSDSGYVKLSRLTNDELTGTKAKAGILEQYLYLLGAEERPLIKDVHLKDQVRVGEDYCNLFTLADVEDLPALCGSRMTYDPYSTDKTRFSTGLVAPLGLLLDCDHVYSQYIFIGDEGKVMKALEAKKLRLQSLSAYSRENAIARDATNDFLNEAISQQRLPVKAHFNVLAWANNTDELQRIRNKVGSAMAKIDAQSKLETDGAPQIWWGGIPGNAADFPANDTFDTFLEQAVCFLNTESVLRSAKTGIRFGERLSGRPLLVDLFDAPMKNGTITNRNLFVCGGSGGGKSMTMNHLLRTLFDQGTHCVTIDIGGSYKGLCELTGGYYFTYTEENPIRFNPFYIGPGEVLDTEKKESLKTLLVSLWKQEDESYNRSEYVALSNALQGFYDHLREDAALFPCFNTFYEYLENHYVSVLEAHKVQAKDFSIHNFLYVLRPYYKGGEFDYLLNATENLDLLNQRFIVFELDNVKAHPILFPVVTLIIMELFISKMRKLQGVRKIIAIDEAWVAIAKAGMSQFIKYLYKTVRKFNGIAALVTQEIDDLISSPILKETVINNADTKILMDMRKFMNKFDKLQEVLGLSDKGKTLLLSVNKANEPGRNYREVFIDQGGQVLNVYRNELAVEEYLCYSTEESEKLRVQEYTAKYGSIEKGIAALANDLTQIKS
ncbi:TraG family conjugative transposon ATPase [Mucilaginibacter paludis]|uniref:Conjugation system ATPase, TraG family n=1 Tax=Mucilaginibacter paludis DSM 18603 TaxID=714943 RepID=H1XZ40_9SPHI|nr:TraG family conjugative transposon ATPase [Mucilaginibacter paludis]EHQ24625.1 conjugation system ATPase, TraG family [Mucilaginibacter paludis DSM 18603]